MIRLTLIKDGARYRSRYIERIELPIDYMNDFSLMGFSVDRYQDAIDLLCSSGYIVKTSGENSEIQISSHSDIPEIQALFLRSGIVCSYSDIADTIYQA